jgi:hypothetical protein
MFSARAKAASFTLLLAAVFLLVACSAKAADAVPKDFSFLLDVRNAEKGSPNNFHITINSKGQGYFEEYDTNGSIQYDFNNIATYSPDQILRTGKFKLKAAQQKQLWDAIDRNHFFELTENSQVQIGHSYAFIMVEADGMQHKVDNIGLEVPQIRTIVETVAAMLPSGVDIEYGEGYRFQK